MNRRTLPLLLLLLSCAVSPLFASLPVSLRWTAMGESGLALTDTPDAFNINPASLLRMEPALFTLDIGYMDSFSHPAADSFEVLPFLTEPESQAEFTFTTPYSALSVALEYSLSERDYTSGEQSVSFSGYNNSFLRLNLAYGNETFSIGAYAEGGSTLYRSITIEQDQAFLDYFSQVYLSRYSPSGMYQSFSTGLGLLVTYPFLSFGVLTDNLFGYDHTSNEITFDLQELVDATSVGFAFSTETYDSSAQLNRFVLSSAIDFTDLGDTTERAIHFGGELKIQFLKDLYAALQAGYKEARPSPDPFFGFSWDGTVSFGLTFRYHDIYYNTAVSVPALWFSGSGEDEKLSAVMSLSYVF